MESGSGLSVGDALALSKNNDGFMSGGWEGIIGLLVIAGIFSGGWGFGNNNAGVTEEYIANQFSQRDLYNNNTNILTTAAATQNEILTNRFNCSQNYANIDKDVLIGNQTIQSAIAQTALQNQAALDSCCCTIRSELRDQIQSVKDLVNNNTIQDLRDQLNTATIASANSVQTSNILSNLGRFYINQPINPYYAYGYTGTQVI